MKRIIALTILLCLCLCSCGNMSMGIGNYSFEHIHFSDGTTEGGRCATVEKWYDSEYGGIEVKTKECGPMFLAEGTYILFGEARDCPYCK